QNVPPAQVELDWNHPRAQAFRAAMDDDFNTSGAVAVLFELASEANRDRSPQASGLLRALGGLLGLLRMDPAVYQQSPSRYQRGGAGQEALSAQEVEAQIADRAAA